ncbi:class I SAM-dependent methyltransferase [bacterium]|nr:class I SAM-dependent methyltransferase [bacterium]
MADHTSDGRQWELNWQKAWVDEFTAPGNLEKVEKYWYEYRHLADVLELCQPKQSIDIGCGISTVLHYIAGDRVGVDALADEYRKLYEYPEGMQIVQGCAEQLPFADGQFDMAWCSNVIDHCTSPHTAMREIQRVLHSGGHLLLACDTHNEDGGFRNEAHPHTFTSEKLLALVEGLTIVRQWESPWVGLRRYCEGLPATGRTETLLLCRVG